MSDESERARFTRRRRAGEGGMGEVYETWDPVIARRTAMKKLRADRAEHEGAFVQEARVAGRLEHPNIVPVHELGTDDGRPYFTMPWVDGATLAERLRTLPPSHDTLVDHLETVARVMDAVAFTHAQGVIHCDLKPENVMVGRYGRVYLVDWGVARIYDPEVFDAGADQEIPRPPASDGVRLGTLEYMAPEQVRGQNSSLGPACDVWALGVMLYECLTGTTPFAGPTPDATMAKILGGDFEPASTRASGRQAPREIEAIVERALEYDPSRRYPSVEAMHEQLRAFLRGTSSLERRAYDPGDIIILQDDTGQEAYVLESGRCEVWMATDGSEPTMLGSIAEGDFFGEAALVRDTERSASVMAATPCVVRVVDRDTVQRERERMQPWLASFMTTLVERARTTSEEVAQAKSRSSPEALELQALLWLSAFGVEEGEGRSGSWRACASHVRRTFGVGVGRLRDALEAAGGFRIDGKSDLIVVEHLENALATARASVANAT